MDKNIVQVLLGLLKALKISVTRKSVIEEVANHPDSPSISTISDLFDKWQIPNGAYQLTVEDLVEFPIPFIAHLNINNGEFALITAIEKDYIVASNERWENHKIYIDKFKEIFSGTALLAQREDNSGEIDYKSKRAEQRLDSLRLPALILAIIFVVMLALKNGTLLFPSFIILLILKIVGIFVSILLLIQHFDVKNPFIRSLCKTGRKVDCNMILSSKQSKLFGLISWAELGFFYFTSTWLFLISDVNQSSFSILAVVTMVTLPYTFYSIYFQAFIAKKWCVLCCIIQIVFWLELLVTISEVSFKNEIPITSIIRLSLYFFLVITSWLFIKPLLISAQQFPLIKSQLFHTKYNPVYFWALLEKQNKVSLLEQKQALIIGNAESEYTVTMAANINCTPCADAHKILEEWCMEKDSFKLQIVFVTSDSIKDSRKNVAAHLMALYRNDRDTMRHALNDWYNRMDKNYETWSLQFPVEIMNEDFKAVEIQNSWSQLAKIEFTPTLFINGSKVPPNFKVQELKYFI
ncbi:vitamin K epoxide reductase family protein [Pedobacter jejuensis]|uniref:Peptidase C39 domain-containing protein n=1 Tax=Pedobacter jejuensis TaxID=1268550 RepID=A0A3N0BZS8_9SPHI|nr:vitamin K epoxide reductase family protein [Pedobacter jejuensis]RNL55416.1 hypothetical protein D7004_04870 [Pedobacter jejuensis]